MKITGYDLRSAINEWEGIAAVNRQLFVANALAFPSEITDETKDRVKGYMRAYKEAEENVARLQTIQAEYNLSVRVDWGEGEHSLAYVVKMIGGAGRAVGLWKKILPTQDPYYSRHPMTRSEGEENQIPILDDTTIQENLRRARRRADAIRNAIGKGNATPYDIGDEFRPLFDLG